MKIIPEAIEGGEKARKPDEIPEIGKMNRFRKASRRPGLESLTHVINLVAARSDTIRSTSRFPLCQATSTPFSLRDLVASKISIYLSDADGFIYS